MDSSHFGSEISFFITSIIQLCRDWWYCFDITTVFMNFSEVDRIFGFSDICVDLWIFEGCLWILWNFGKVCEDFEVVYPLIPRGV